MVGSGLKKLAQENEMTVANGVAYGSLRGYTATLSEGSGYKRIVLSTAFPHQERMDALLHRTEEIDLKKEFRVLNLTFAPNGVDIVFHDNPGTMKKIRSFIDWFWPLLGEYGATGANICPRCKTELTAGKWILVDGVAMHMHDSCCQSYRSEIETEEDRVRDEDTGSYGMGLVGALLGSVVGAALWAVVLNLGYVAAIVGYVIGWLAEKGYSVLHGRKGPGKAVILAVAVIFGVVLGNFMADAYTLVTMIHSGELLLSYGEIPSVIIALMIENPEYLSATLRNMLMGLLFAALGVFSLIRRTGKETAPTKFVELN